MECDTTGECVNSIASTSLQVIIFYFMLIGIIKVQKDTNHILDKMDVFYLSLSLTQQILITGYQAFYENLTYLLITRILRLYQEAIFMNFLTKLLFESEKIHRIIDRFLQSVLAFGMIYLALINVIIHFDQTVECHSLKLTVLSSINLGLMLINLILGLYAVQLIASYLRELGPSQITYDGLQRITQDEMNNRKVQVLTIMSAQGISSIALFVNDYFNIIPCDGQRLMVKVLQKQKILIINSILIFVTITLPNLAIHHVFYSRNQKYFNSHEGVFEKNLGNFYDYRSEIALIEM